MCNRLNRAAVLCGNSQAVFHFPLLCRLISELIVNIKHID